MRTVTLPICTKVRNNRIAHQILAAHPLLWALLSVHSRGYLKVKLSIVLNVNVDIIIKKDLSLLADLDRQGRPLEFRFTMQVFPIAI